jgi:hypothetical protein
MSAIGGTPGFPIVICCRSVERAAQELIGARERSRSGDIPAYAFPVDADAVSGTKDDVRIRARCRFHCQHLSGFSMRMPSPSVIPGILLLFLLPMARAERFILPVDWSEGESVRYQAEWQRRSDPGTALAAVMADESLVGDVEIRVISAKPGLLRLNWQPVFERKWRPDIVKPNEIAVAGTILWRHLRTLQQDLALTPHPLGATLQLENAVALQIETREGIHRVLSQLGIDMRCTTESADVLCARVASADVAASWTLQASAPFFNCVGLEVDSEKPMRWRIPFQMDTDLQAEPIESAKEFSVEALNFDPDAAELHIRLLETRDITGLLKLVDRYAGRMDPQEFAEMRDGVVGDRYSYETDCRMDRKTGWPIEVSYTIRLESRMGGGSERLHYLRKH